MARGMIRFYGHGAVSQPVGFTSQVIFRFSNGYYDLDAAAVAPMVLSKLMRRFPYQNLDAEGNPIGERMLNGVPFAGQTGGVKIIVNEKALRPNQKNLVTHEENMPNKEPVLSQQTPQENEAQAGPSAAEPAPSGTLTVAAVKEATTRKAIVALAKEAGVAIERSDKTEEIRQKILKTL